MFTGTVMFIFRLLHLFIFRRPVVDILISYLHICPTMWSVYKDNFKVCSGFGIQCIRHCLTLKRFIKEFLYFLSFRFARKPDAIATTSKFVKEHLYNAGIKSVHYFSPWPRAFHADQFIEQEEDARYRKDLFFMGRLSQEKDPLSLVRAFKTVLKRFPDASLTIVGSGPLEEELLDLTKELRVSNIRFTGIVPVSEIGNYYKKATLVIIPGIWLDVGPATILEALSAGVPVIASNRCAFSEFIIDGKNGYIYNALSCEDLSDKIIKALSNIDPLIKGAKESRLDIISNYNLYRCTKELLDILKLYVKKR
jgi:glycosyltransferase involved in cell wall biosynthesis